MSPPRGFLGRWIGTPGRARPLRGVVIAGVFAVLNGCASPGGPAADLPGVSHAFQVEPGRRVAALEAAVATLRDAGYAVDRADYRLGVVTTRPEPVPTALEPWHGSRQLQSDPWAATSTRLRRIVRVDFASAEASASEVQLSEQDPAAPLRLRVQLERYESPVVRLVNAANGRVFSSLSDVPTPWAQRSLRSAYWRPVGRDPAEEARLAAALSRALAHAPAARSPAVQP